MSITSESYWGREIVPAALNGVFRACCEHFKSNPLSGGTKGNTAHTTGRHRSMEWCLHSAYSTDTDYGTRDRRDRDGNSRHIRAFDVALTSSQIRTVSHRLDEAVRGGDAPMIAEWFGTFDNRNVTGWYEGHRSSSDSSHLQHVHVGLWTEFADDAKACDTVYEIMTGDTVALTDAEIKKIAAATAVAVWDLDGIPAPRPPYTYDDYGDPDDPDTGNKEWQAKNMLRNTIESVREVLAKLEAQAGTPPAPGDGTNTATSGTGTFTWTSGA